MGHQMTDAIEPTEFVRVVPTDLYPAYLGPGQFAPEEPEDILAFDRALQFELNHRNAPLEYREAYEMPPEAAEWAQNPDERRNLILWGNAGVGKTHSAVAAGCLYAGVHQTPFLLLRSGQLLKSAKNYDSKSEMANAKADATIPGVVLIDDIGRTKATDTDIETFSDMMDARRAGLKPTIFTTNAFPGSFGEVFGDHLASRLLGGALVINVVGPDRRDTP